MTNARRDGALYAEVTAAIHDMNGFADLGEISVEEYRAAETFEWPDTADVNYILDLCRNNGDRLDEKLVSRETAAALLGADPATLDQKARQRLAFINDEASAHLRRLSSKEGVE